MNSCRSLDNGCIRVLGYDQFKQQLQFFISGQRAVILIVGIISFFKGTKFTNYLFHVEEKRIAQLSVIYRQKGMRGIGCQPLKLDQEKDSRSIFSSRVFPSK